ncbi:hypothetical protein G7046_g2559 [Stylonectria norvegica]|nr:hypothetical protein G7046_g2559 [Stylonectria norvegica]
MKILMDATGRKGREIRRVTGESQMTVTDSDAPPIPTHCSQWPPELSFLDFHVILCWKAPAARRSLKPQGPGPDVLNANNNAPKTGLVRPVPGAAVRAPSAAPCADYGRSVDRTPRKPEHGSRTDGGERGAGAGWSQELGFRSVASRSHTGSSSALSSAFAFALKRGGRSWVSARVTVVLGWGHFLLHLAATVLEV